MRGVPKYYCYPEAPSDENEVWERKFAWLPIKFWRFNSKECYDIEYKIWLGFYERIRMFKRTYYNPGVPSCLGYWKRCYRPCNKD